MGRPATSGAIAGGAIDSFNVGPEAADPADVMAGEALGASGIGATCITLNGNAKTPGTAVIIEPLGQICGGVFSGLDNQLLPGPVTGVFEVQVFVDGTATQPN